MSKNKLSNANLGSLENEIMEVVWKCNECTVREVLNKIKRSKKPAYTTIMTVMSRLFDKGILKRQKNDHDAYVYSPVKGKTEFAKHSTKSIISKIFNDFGEEVAVAQFMDHMEKADLEKSKELRGKLLDILSKTDD